MAICCNRCGMPIYSDGCCGCRYPRNDVPSRPGRGPTGPTGPTGPAGLTGPTGPIRSSFVEAIADTQTVAVNGNIIFQVSENVGNAISFTPPGDTFTINRRGLYLVEWSVNLADDNVAPSIVGTMEIGEPGSALASAALSGNLSSGVLIEVDTVPYTISLHNFNLTDPISLASHANWQYTAASIRILRFADLPDA